MSVMLLKVEALFSENPVDVDQVYLGEWDTNMPPICRSTIALFASLRMHLSLILKRH